MQQKSENYSEFSERTEVLASNLGINLSDLPAKIGVSNSMFHAYRSGKYPISEKAWSKLERCEQAAGINGEGTQSAQSSAKPEEAGIGDPAQSACAETPMGRADQFPDLGKMMEVLERIAVALEALVEIQQKP
jgi:ribosome-binding protein aMBF1 (putative translation factor)